MFAVIKKEFKSYFLSPIGYVFIGLFLIMFSIFFYTDVINYGSTNFEYIFYSGATILTFIVPILTMRTFAEERKTGTEQLLLTSPLSITKVILGKFIAATLIVIITELCTFMYFGILCYYGVPHITTALATMLGFLLLAMSYISFGMLASSITENQIIAGVITIGFFILTWFLPQFSTVFTNFSLINMFSKFPQGQIDIADTVTFISFTVACILLTAIVMQRRKKREIGGKIKLKEKKIKEKKEKDQKENKFLQIIKKKWLINGTTTLALVLIIILVFIALNMWMQSLELTPIDLSQEKLYTLTDESKEKVKNIDKDINLYFVGYTDSDSTVDLAKQYKKVNEKINAEAVDATTRPDLVEKYGIESGSEGIIVECGDKSKVLTSSDLVTYDTTTYETISIAEQKLTSSIIAVATDKVPKVYFLEGYSDYKLSNNMTYLGIYLSNEVTEVDTLDVLSTGKIPDDCDTLIICTPKKDFDEIAANAIIDYINSGRNILWLNSAVTSEQNFPNVNKILALYGVKPFEIGIIRETDSSKMLQGSPDIIKPDALYSTITKDIAKDSGVRFINATKINLVSEEELENLKVNKTELLNASEKSYFRNNFKIQTDEKSSSDVAGKFLVGAELEKTITEANEENGTKAVKSKMVIYGENNFTTDYPVSNYSQVTVFQLANNKDLVLNSIAYLVDRQEDITARKNTGTVSYRATEQEDTIIKCIIFVVPALIIIAGIIVWIIRRRKK